MGPVCTTTQRYSTVFDPYWGNWATPWSTPATLIPKNGSKWTHVGLIRALNHCLPDCLLNQIRKSRFGPIWQLGWYSGLTVMVSLDNGVSYSLPIFKPYGFHFPCVYMKGNSFHKNPFILLFESCYWLRLVEIIK